MVDVYAVEATLRLNDQLVQGLRRVSAELRTIDAQWANLQKRIAAPLPALAQMRSELSTIAKEASGASQSMRGLRVPPSTIGNIQRLETALAGAEARAAALAGSMAAIGGRGAFLFGRGGGGGGGHGGGRGGGGGVPHRGLRGRFHAGMVGGHFGIGAADIAGLGLAGGAYLGLHEAAQEQRALLAAVLASGEMPSSQRGQQEYVELRGMVEQISRGSIFSPATVAKALPSILGLSDVPYAEAKSLLLPATRFAETANIVGASQGHAPPIEESAQAAIRMAHVLGVLDPDKMKPILDMALVAQMTTGRTLGQLEKTMMYFAGTARTAGMTPKQTMEFGAISSLFLPGTTAGTALNNMILGMIPLAGPGSGTNIHRTAGRTRDLVRMGLIDPKTHAIRPDENGDMVRGMILHLEQARQKMKPTEFVGMIRSLFNLRGMREAEALSVPGVLEKLDTLLERMNKSPDALGMQRELLGPGLIPQMQYAWANVKGIMDILTTGTIPGLTGALSKLNDGMDWVRRQLTDARGNPTGLATGLGYGVEGVGALLVARMAKRLLWGAGGRAAAGGAAAGGGLGLFGGLASLFSGATALGGLGMFLPDSMLPEGMSEKRGDLFDRLRGWINRTVTGKTDDQLKAATLNALPLGYAARTGWWENLHEDINAPLKGPFGTQFLPGGTVATQGANPMPPIEVHSDVHGQIIINMGEIGTLVKDFIMHQIGGAADHLGPSGTGARPTRETWVPT